MSDLSAELLQTLERSIGASPRVFRQRVWRTLDRHGVEIGPLVVKIRQDIAAERKSGKGRQARTEYNAPPAALRRQFEAAHAVEVTPGTPEAPGQTRYLLQGPIEKYKTDYAPRELESFLRAITAGIHASRQRITGAYGEGSGGVSKRSGGVVDRQRLAYTEHQHNLSQLPREWWPILQKICEGGVTVAQVGAWILPGVRNAATLNGAGRAALRMMAQTITDIDIKRRGALRGEQPDARMLSQMRAERAARRRSA